MKKLLSIITALTVASSATSSLVSCKVLTNPFDISFNNWKTLESLKYEFNEITGEYEQNQNYENKEEDVKKALDGAYGAFGSTIVSDIINSLFYNANLNVTKNSQRVWQYLYTNDDTKDKGIYADGQFRTAGISSKNEAEVKAYYENVTQVASILGYSQWSQNGADKRLDDDTINYINQMFDSSKNQGITDVKIDTNLSVYNGKVNLFESEDNSGTYDENTKKTWTSGEDKNYVSNEIYKNQWAIDNDKYEETILGTNFGVDPYSQLFISEVNGLDETISNLNNNITINQVTEQSEENKKHEQGEILNSQDSSSNDSEQGIEFEYVQKENKDKNNNVTSYTYTPYAYGYALIPMQNVKMQITYNDDRDLRTGEARGNDYILDVEVSGLNAAFKPVLGFTTEIDKNQNLINTKDRKPYVGWRFAGYQFNSKNILGFQEDGKAFTERPDKNMTPTNKKFNDFKIESLKIVKQEKQENSN
ncbi:hypothetical protein CK556_00500 [Mesoplasma chauliocola]|uniref:DUF31 domain-containing protein n=1 Tax=Mesoplasma chauliocola TaxID=216427 RepID=A0A249SMH5_9MOLU|nr:hypothetical protein [Mesoplasma chauliocola]ASZ08846.1 hypothetical protein CK556_00500 [Mesoplasma chauliocola]